jgi:hypothetical protein
MRVDMRGRGQGCCKPLQCSRLVHAVEGVGQVHAGSQRELPSALLGTALLAISFDDSLMKGIDWRGERGGSSMPDSVSISLSSCVTNGRGCQV